MKLETTAEHDSFSLVDNQHCYKLSPTTFILFAQDCWNNSVTTCQSIQLIYAAKVCYNLGESRFRHAAKGECIFGCVRKETPCPTVIYNLALPSFQESGWLRRFLSKYTPIRLSSACPSYTTWTHLEVSWRGLSCVHLFHLLRYPFLGDRTMLEYSAMLIN